MNHIIKQASVSQELIQLATLKFKPTLQQGTELPLSFRDVCRQLQAVPGVSSTYFGEQIERPGTWTWIIRWASPAAHDAFLASPSFTNWIASFRAVVQTYIFWKALVRGSLSATLNAPCTEVFTAYGTSDTWLEMRMKPFAENVDAGSLAGHHGSFYGQYDVLMHDTPNVPEGNTVSMMLGWDSKEAHLAERGQGKCKSSSLASTSALCATTTSCTIPPLFQLLWHARITRKTLQDILTQCLVIDKNIHFIRDERKSVDMVC
jgi:quinol monooxygenase YgiN